MFSNQIWIQTYISINHLKIQIKAKAFNTRGQRNDSKAEEHWGRAIIKFFAILSPIQQHPAAQSIVLNLLLLRKRTAFDVISFQNESFSYVVLTYSTFGLYESIFSSLRAMQVNPLICVDAKLVRCTNVYTYEALFPIRFCSVCDALGYGKCTLNTNNIGGTSSSIRKKYIKARGGFILFCFYMQLPAIGNFLRALLQPLPILFNIFCS